MNGIDRKLIARARIQAHERATRISGYLTLRASAIRVAERAANAARALGTERDVIEAYMRAYTERMHLLACDVMWVRCEPIETIEVTPSEVL